MSHAISVTATQRRQLLAILQCPRAPLNQRRRAQVVLLSAEGRAGQDVAVRLGITPEQISRIRRRFLDLGVDGLMDCPRRGRRDHAVPKHTVDRILRLVRSPPPPGRSRWTTRALADEVELSSATVAKILRGAGIQLQLMRTYDISRDPSLQRGIELVGLHLHPLASAIAIASDRDDVLGHPVERCSACMSAQEGPGSGSTGEHLQEALRHGRSASRAPSARRPPPPELRNLVEKMTRLTCGKDVHVIVDNSSSTSRRWVESWCDAGPLLELHYLPTSSAWLRQVELVLSLIGRTGHEPGSVDTSAMLSLIRARLAHPRDDLFRWAAGDCAPF